MITSEQRSQFLVLVDRFFGIRVSDYSAQRLDHAINRVLPTTTCNTAGELLETLGRGEHERWLSDVVEYLTVGETYFFRDSSQISALRDTVLPDVIARRAADRRLRFWSAGCSTGEELYTLGILLLDHGLPPDPAWDVLLFGTDVNRESLRIASDGRYAARSFRATPDETRERYFETAGREWRPIEPVRRMTHFAWTNLGADQVLPPAVELDLIMCRNVTIYFEDLATQRLYATLIGALAQGGWLLLGPSDALPADRSELERVDMHNAVLWRRVAPVKRPKRAPKERVRVQPAAILKRAPRVDDARTEVNAGLLALEAGSAVWAIEALRRATFRDPGSVLGQFALASAYLGIGEFAHARAALLQTRRLLMPLAADAFVTGADSLPVETLRQTIETRLSAIEGRQDL
jgi:chemotaxis methyl-accepting protein methylase